MSSLKTIKRCETILDSCLALATVTKLQGILRVNVVVKGWSHLPDAPYAYILCCGCAYSKACGLNNVTLSTAANFLGSREGCTMEISWHNQATSGPKGWPLCSTTG